MQIYAYLDSMDLQYAVQAVDFSTGVVQVDMGGDTIVELSIRDVRLCAGGDTSDRYNTFNTLYNHRAFLFRVLLLKHPETAWKARIVTNKGIDTMQFLAGISTPAGDFSIRCPLECWEEFTIKELAEPPQWEGHMPSDISRLSSL